MKILLVFNNYAGNRRAASLLENTKQRFSEAGINYDILIPSARGMATEQVKKTELSAYDGVVAAGGDGTLYEVINGLQQNPGSKKPPLGVLPIGTGNAFARDIDLHVDKWEEAVDIIKQGHTRKVDIGTFRTGGLNYHFLNIIGLGFVADVGETAQKLKVFGNLSYTLGVVYQTLFLNPVHMKITADGQSYDTEAVFVEVSNSRYTANFLMAPHAELDDGLLDVTIAKPMNRIKLLKSFPKILTGDHIHMDEVEHFKAREISIIPQKEKILTPDGELMGSTPVHIGVIPKGVDFFWRK